MFVVSRVWCYNIRTCIGSFLLFFSQRFFYLIIHFVVVVSPWKQSMVLFYLQSKRREKKVRDRTTHTIIRWWHSRVIRRWCQYCRGLDLWVHYIQITHTVEIVCDICAVSFALNALILLFFICGAFYDTIYTCTFLYITSHSFRQHVWRIKIQL